MHPKSNHVPTPTNTVEVSEPATVTTTEYKLVNRTNGGLNKAATIRSALAHLLANKTLSTTDRIPTQVRAVMEFVKEQGHAELIAGDAKVPAMLYRQAIVSTMQTAEKKLKEPKAAKATTGKRGPRKATVDAKIEKVKAALETNATKRLELERELDALLTRQAELEAQAANAKNESTSEADKLIAKLREIGLSADEIAERVTTAPAAVETTDEDEVPTLIDNG